MLSCMKVQSITARKPVQNMLAMLAAGASKHWQHILEKSIGTREMDASAILD